MIIIPTYLEICECGQHGRFVSPDNTRSTEFGTREEAQRELGKLLSDGKITDVEFSFLKASILESSIRAEEDVHPLTQLLCSVFNYSLENENRPKGDSVSKQQYLM